MASRVIEERVATPRVRACAAGAILPILRRIIPVDWNATARPMTESIPLYRPVRTGALVVLGVWLALLAGITAGGVVRGLTSSCIPISLGADETDVLVKKVRPDYGTLSGEVRPGDRIRAVNGIPIRDGFYFIHLVGTGRPGAPVALTIEREGGVFDVVMTPRPGLDPGWPSQSPLLVCILLSWGVVGILLWNRPRDPQVVRIALVSGVGLAVIGIKNPLAGGGSDNTRIFWVTVFIALSGVLCAQFLYFCSRYPVRVTLPRWVLPTAWGGAGILTAASLVTFERCLQWHYLVPLWNALRLLFGFNALLALAGFGLLIRSYLRSLAPDRRQQVRWVVFGLLVGLLPQTLLEVLPRALGAQPLAADVLVQSFFLAVPIGFFASFLRYRLFDVDMIMGRSSLIGLMGLGVILVRAMIAQVLGPPAGGSTGSLAAATIWGGSVLFVGTPAVIFRRQLERPLGVPGLTPAVLKTRIEETIAAGGDRQVLLQRFLEQLTGLVRIERAAAFLADPATGRLFCAATVNCSAISTDGLSIEASGSLVSWLRLERKPVRVRNYDRQLGMDLLHPDERSLIESLDAAIILPVLASGGLEAALTFSSHCNGALPNSVLVHSLGEAAERLASALSKAAMERETLASEDLRSPAGVRPPRPTPRSGDDRAVPRRIGPYRLDEMLGSGSSGEVWGSTHEPTGTRVALKRLHRHLGSDPQAFRRFMQEVSAMTQVDDPYVVRILDCGNTEGTPWFAMEWIEGETLRRRLERARPLAAEEALSYGAQVARGLHACHRAGLIHRDVAPANILLSGRRARIADLGLVHRPPSAKSLDRETALAGTILYMSPEQVAGRRLGPGSDIFSLGSILYECLTGRAAFEGESLAATIARIETARVASLAEARPDLPGEVARLVDSLLALRPEARPSTA